MNKKEYQQQKLVERINYWLNIYDEKKYVDLEVIGLLKDILEYFNKEKGRKN